MTNNNLVSMAIVMKLKRDGDTSAKDLVDELSKDERYGRNALMSNIQRMFDRGELILNSRLQLALPDVPDNEEWLIETMMFNLVNGGECLTEYEPYLRKLWEAYCTYQQFARDATLMITSHVGGGSELFGKELFGVFMADLSVCKDKMNGRIESERKRADRWQQIAEERANEISGLQTKLKQAGLSRE